MKRFLITLVAALAALALAVPAQAATVTLFGSATQEAGHVKLVSNTGDVSTANDFGGVSITGLGSLTVGSLEFLGVEFNVTDDGCGGGSPRFVLVLDNGAAVNVALGDPPSFTSCPLNQWLNSGNLVGKFEGCRWHITSPPALADPCLTAAELQALASRTITEIRLVADGGWFFADKEQTVLVRNAVVNSTLVLGTVTNGGLNPSRTCRAIQSVMGASAFRTAFGTNTNGRNAFGKCVSMMAKAKRTGMIAAFQTAVLNAVNACKASSATGTALTQCIVSDVRSVFAATKISPASVKAMAGKKPKKKGKR
jgi:hypothetical protein